jgi:hypothetical protein
MFGEVIMSADLEGTGVDERIILKWIFKNWDGGEWTGMI